MTVTVRQARQADLAGIRNHYARCGYGGEPEANETIFIAEDREGIIAAVRLVREAGIAVLRGMQVAPKWQRRGVGTALLEACCRRLGDEPCFCLAHAHLERFYGQAGFSRLHPHRAPGHLRERLETYRERFPTLLALVRGFGGDAP